MPLFQDKQDSAIFVDPETGKSYSMTDVYEGSYYDTVQIAGTPSATYKLFRDLDNKNKQHSNLDQQNHIPGEHAFVMQRVSVDILQALGATIAAVNDIKQILYNGYLEVKLGSRLVAEGLLVDFPAGRGLTGAISTTASNTTHHALSNGVPSRSANPSSIQPQFISDRKGVYAEAKFDGATWATSYSAVSLTANPGTALQLSLLGLVTKPITG